MSLQEDNEERTTCKVTDDHPCEEESVEKHHHKYHCEDEQEDHCHKHHGTIGPTGPTGPTGPPGPPGSSRISWGFCCQSNLRG